MADEYDLIVVGGGPGGYVCAIRAAQLGKKVALVEKRGGGKPELGGTCLNVGCIPSKALLDSSEHFARARDEFAAHGIVVKPQLDLARMMKRKEKVVATLVGGLGHLMKKNRIRIHAGTGKLVDEGRVRVVDEAGDRRELRAMDVVLAAGSVPIELEALPFDREVIVSSDEALRFERVPEHLVVVGAGVVGLELGSVWSRLGAKVTVVEALERPCPFLDDDVADALVKHLGKQGLEFRFGAKVTGAEVKRGRAEVALEGGDPLTADKVLVAVGRRAASDDLDEAGLEFDDRGRVVVDRELRTSIPHVHAIGDLIEGPMLAHKAEEEGVAVAERLAGEDPEVDHDLIPNVIYTHPEVATVGWTEARAEKEGVAVAVGRVPFSANGRAKAAGDDAGFVKLIAEKDTDRLRGAAIVGPRASDLIAEVVATMAFGGAAEDLARTCHAHPTFAESIKEAALDVLGRVVHG